MKKHDLVYLTEDASHDAAIEIINEEAFGPGRFTRAAARIREQGPHDRALSFICADNGETIASVRMTPVTAGSVKGHLLGPLAVRPSHKNQGIGRELVRIAVEAAAGRAPKRLSSSAIRPIPAARFREGAPWRAPIPGSRRSGEGSHRAGRAGRHARLEGMIAWRDDGATCLTARAEAQGAAA